MLFQQYHHEALGSDILTTSEWEVLQRTAEFLQPFWQATVVQEKHWSLLDQVLYTMDILLKHFEDARVRLILRITSRLANTL
jgi:hypothetical protein